MSLTVFKCLLMVLVFVDAAQCVLGAVNIVIELFFVKPLLILHNRSHSMCVYIFYTDF